MYGWNDFSFKNVLGAAYNQVRFLVWNLRYILFFLTSQALPVHSHHTLIIFINISICKFYGLIE